jgi:hypothetical protein
MPETVRISPALNSGMYSSIASLAMKRAGPASDVEDANPGRERDHRRQRRVVTAGRDVDAVAASGERTGHLVDIDVLATGIDAAERSERRGMLADQCDLHGRFRALVPRYEITCMASILEGRKEAFGTSHARFSFAGPGAAAAVQVGSSRLACRPARSRLALGKRCRRALRRSFKAIEREQSADRAADRREIADDTRCLDRELLDHLTLAGRSVLANALRARAETYKPASAREQEQELPMRIATTTSSFARPGASQRRHQLELAIGEQLGDRAGNERCSAAGERPRRRRPRPGTTFPGLAAQA